MERETGFEPATACLEGRGSTTELLPHRGEILEGCGGWGQGRVVRHRVCIQSSRGGSSIVGFGVPFCLLGCGSAMEDACWTLPLFLCFGCSDDPGQGRRPAFAAAAACGPVCAGLRQGPTGPSVPSPTPGSWLHRYRAGKRLVQRPDGASCRRNISKFAGATRSTGTTGSRLY